MGYVGTLDQTVTPYKFKSKVEVYRKRLLDIGYHKTQKT